MQFTRFIALGDSMTEGMSDELINGKYRGWADRVADSLARNNPDFTYMNLAVRGKLLKQVVEDQIPFAVNFVDGPQTLISFHAGANDVLRPNYKPEISLPEYEKGVKQLTESGATVIIFTVVDKVEGKGLSRLVRENCDLVLSIPMQSDVESLNASVATAIVMHWVATERNK